MFAVRPVRFSQVCVKENVGDFEISIAFDDSCGALVELSRADIRIFSNTTHRDVTKQAFGDVTVIGTIENLIEAYRWAISNS